MVCRITSTRHKGAIPIKKKSSPKSNSRKELRGAALIEQLEPRVLFSADTLVLLNPETSDPAEFGTTLETGIDLYDSHRTSEDSTVPDSQKFPVSNTSTTPVDLEPKDQRQVDLETESSSSTTVNWVFVDPDIEQAGTLVEDIKESSSSNSKWHIVWIDQGEDGFKQITETLNGVNNVDSIHILSHGDNNGFQLGNVKLAQSNIENYYDDFQLWQHSLTGDADILIYGCDLASTENGKKLVASIAEHTQSDVAASIDTTGHQSRDANWNLEYQHGEVGTNVAISESAQSQWIGELPLNNAPINLGSGIEINTDGGNDAYLSTNQGAAILGDASALTVEFLLQSTTEKEQHLLTYSTAANEAFAIILKPDVEQIRVVINGTTHYFYLPEYTIITDGDIHHFAVSWDNTNGDVTIYIDGEKISQHSDLNKNDTLGTDLLSSITIGQQTTSPNSGHDVLKNFTGTLHDIKIWNEARTQAQIDLSYQHKLDPSNLPASLVANWQMESLTGAGSNIIEDVANNFDLLVGHASGIGFIESLPSDNLHVAEQSLNGTTVGYVVPSDPDHFENLISNGNFLEGVPTNSSATHTTGTMLGAWEVTSDDVRSHGSYLANGPHGGIPLELGDTAPGQITQTIATEIGTTYQMTFAMTADFDKPFTNIRTIEVAADAITEQYTINEPNGWTTSNLLWDTRTLTFTATNNLTEISFTSLNSDGTDASVVITDVQVTEVPTAVATLINGDPNMRYDAGTGKFYRFVDTATQFFPAIANAVASELNGVKGQLLTIGSKYENDFIYNDYAIPSGNSIWIGIQEDQSNTNNEWYWMEGNEVTDKLVWLGDTNGSAQDGYYVPGLTQSDAADEHVARLHTTGDQWVDTSATSYFSYIIEWNASEVLSNFTYEFTPGGDAGGRFAIDSSSGEIIVANGAALDYIANNSHDVEIQVTDADGNSYIQTLTIAVEDVFQLTQQVPGALNTDEDTALVFSTANTNAITIDDGVSLDDTPLRVVLENGLTGTFTLAQPNTVTIVDGADGGATITFEGTVSEINTALNGLSYLPNQNYSGLATIAVTTSVDADNLAHYEFNGNTSNSGLNPAYDGGPLEGNASVTDPTDPDVLVLTTDGDGDLLPIPSLFGEPPALGPPSVTLAARIKADSPDLYGSEVISIANQVILRVDGESNLVGYAYNGTTYQKVGSEKIKLHDSEWHHVAYTIDDVNKIYSLYVDGIKVGAVSFNDSTSYATSFTRTTIGSHAQPGNLDFEFFGSIDDARIYDRALSEAEIYGLARDNFKVTDTIPVTVNSIDDAPVIGNLESTPETYSENAPSIALTSALTITDIDDTNIETATIWISSGFNAGDRLNFTNQLGISGLYNNSTGELALTGPASLIDYQTAIQSITFDSTSEDPTEQTRTITFVVNDGDLPSNQLSRNIEVTEFNDAPTLSSIETSAATYTENATATTVTTSITVADVDDDFIESATVSISNNYSASDTLTFTNQLGINGFYNNGLLTLTGSASAANYQIALRSVGFENSSDDPSTATRTVTFNVSDGDIDSSPVSRNITFNALNDNPVLSAIEGSDAMYTEGDASIAITNSITVEDVDDINLESAVIEISNNFASGDSLNFTNQLGISGTYNATNGTLSLLGTASVANYQTALRSIEFENLSEDFPSSLRTVTFTVNDGDIDSSPVSRNIVVNAVNDGPLLSAIENTSITYVENAAAISITSSLIVNDVDDTQIESAVVAITSNFSTGDELVFTDQFGITGDFDSVSGELTLTGASLITNYQAALQSIDFQNLGDDPATATRTVTFSVNDGDIDSNLVTRDIIFNAVNDAPVLSSIEGVPTNYTENAPATTTTSGLVVDDIDDTDIESAVIAITGNPSPNDILSFTDQLGIIGAYDSFSSVLTLTGTSSEANYQTAIRSIGFENSSHDPSDLTRTVAFTAYDGDIDSNTVSRDIEFTAVNDAPVLDTIEVTPNSYSEGGAATTITGSVTASDPDDTIIESAVVEISNNFSVGDLLNFTDQSGITGNYNSTNGTLTLSGPSTVGNYQAALRTIEFENSDDNPSTLTRTITFIIRDGGADSNPVSRNIEITAVNDAPSLSSIESTSASFTEGGSATSITNTLAVSDSDDTIIESATVAISNNFSTDDTLNFVDQSGIAGNFNSTTGELTLSGPSSISNYQTALQSVTFENLSDDPVTQTRTVNFGVSDGELESNLIARDIIFNAINDAPVLSNIESAPTYYTENGTTTIVTDNLTVDDVDDINVESATVMISSNFYAGDTLTFTNQLGIVGNYNASNGTLILTGISSEANYQAALQSIGYESTNDNPSDSTRTIIFTLSDGDASSNPVTRDIEFTAVNDAPTLTAIENSAASYTENGAAALITSSMTIVDLDDLNIDSATVSISNNFDTDDILNFSDQSGISGMYDNTSGTLSLSGSALVSDYQNAIRSITFENSGDNSTTATRTVSIVVNDGDISSNLVSRNITVGVINDAPLLSGIESLSTSYTENDPGIVITNTTFITDVDNNDIVSATVSISTNLDQYDELDFVNQLGIAGTYDTATGVLSLSGISSIANYQTAIQSINFINNSEDPSDLTRIVSFIVNDGDIDSNTVTREIAFTAVNDAPELATIETSSTNYIEGGPAIPVTNNLTVTDYDDVDIESATVSISNNLSTGDRLIFNNQLGITGVFVPATGILTLTGTASEANYESAIRAITYENTEDNPSTDVRTITLLVNDGETNSNLVSRNITINSVNDAPALTSIESTAASFTENNAATAITNTLVVEDSDDSILESAQVSITNNFLASDRLSFTDQLGITATYNATTGTLDLSGAASVADYQIALRSVGFETLGDNPSVLSRTVSFTVNDGDTISNTASRDIDINPVNDAPELTNIETTPLTHTENSVQSLITSSLTVSDLDDTNIESATIEISSNHSAGDELTFTDQLGITGAYDSTTGTLALSGLSSTSNYQTAIQSIGFVNTSDDPSSLSRTISFTVYDGHVNSAQALRDIDFVAVNDAPALTTIESSTASYIENGSATYITDSLLLIDVDDTIIESATVEISDNFDPGDLLSFNDQSGITGLYNPATGTLSLIGPSSLAEFQTALRSVTYEYSGENPSTLTRTITFTVNDGDTNSNSVSRNLLVDPVNDPPALSNIESNPATYTENSAQTITTNSIDVSDVDDTYIETAAISITSNMDAGDVLSFTDQLGITGTYNSNTGTLSLEGSATVANYQTAIQSIGFENIGDNPTVLTRTVTFVVNDGDISSNLLTRDIEFTAVNDAPALTAIETNSANYTEGGSATVTTGTLTISDADDTNIDSATISISSNFDTDDLLIFSDQSGITGTYSPATGTLTLSGSSTVANYEAAIRSVKFENPNNNPSKLTRTITYTVNDGDLNSNTVSRNLTFNGVNDAPTLSNIDSTATTYTENSSSSTVASNLSVGDVDDINIESANVFISNNFAIGDQLDFIDQLGISGEYDSLTGVLSMSGSSSLANYQTAMQSIGFSNTSDNPPELTRTVSFIVNDGDIDSNQQSRDIIFTAINDAPELTAIELSSTNYIEGDSATTITGALTITDSDDHNIESATISVSNNFDSGDTLNFTDQLGITGTYNATNGVLTLAGTSSISNYESAIRSISFESLNSNPSTLTRTLSFVISDGDLNSNLISRDITFNAINNAPELASLELPPATYIEGAAAMVITNNLTISDIDDTNIESATVSISNYLTADDRLVFSDQSGISGTYDTDNGMLTLTGSASVVNYQSALRSIGFQNSSDNPSPLTRTVTFTVNDGDLDSAQHSRDIIFTAVNDAPTGLDNVITFLEDSLYTLTPSDFGFLDELENHEFTGIIIESVPGPGTLQLAGSDTTAGQFISNADIIAGNLVYSPQPDVNGALYDNLEFRVVDSGGTDFSGKDTSTVANVIEFNITNVSDEPNGQDTTLITPEDTPYTFNLVDFGYSDVKDNDQFAAITIVSVPADGSIDLGGSSVQPGAVVSAIDIDNGQLQFTPPADYNGIGYNGLSFVVHDSGTDTNGGIYIDQSANLITFDIPGINDGPDLVSSTLSVDEGGTITIDTASLTATDIDNPSEELIFTVTGLPINGILTVANVQIPSAGTFTQTQLQQGDLSYTHDGSETDSDFFNVQVSDEQGLSSNATVSISIEPAFQPALPQPILPTIEQPIVEEIADTEKVELEKHTEQESQSAIIFPATTEIATPDPVTIETVGSPVNEFISNAAEFRYSTGTHDNHNVTQHNKFRLILTEKNQLEITNVDTPIVELEPVNTDWARNENFQRGLDRTQDELDATEDALNNRSKITSDFFTGTSVALTAGILAWLLRGGVLLAGLAASRPLWSHLDPIKFVTGRHRDDADSSEEELDNFFED